MMICTPTLVSTVCILLSLQVSRQCMINAKEVQNEGPHHPFIIQTPKPLSLWALCQAQLLSGPSFSDEHKKCTHTYLSNCLSRYFLFSLVRCIYLSIVDDRFILPLALWELKVINYVVCFKETA